MINNNENNKNKKNITNHSNNKNNNSNNKNNINNATFLMLTQDKRYLGVGPQLSSLPCRLPHRNQSERELDLRQNAWSLTSVPQICFHGLFIIKYFTIII
jgi:hypothetical protein